MTMRQFWVVRGPAADLSEAGTIWTETANARRIHGEWSNALTALERARGPLEAGTGNSLLKARRLSIAASLQSDQCARDEAMALLAECVAIYEAERNWPLAARTLVQMAHSIVDHEPALELASRFHFPGGPDLEVARREQLRRVPRHHGPGGRSNSRPSARPNACGLCNSGQRFPSVNLQSRPTSANFSATREADILFTDALTGDLEAGLHKDALLDLLYISSTSSASTRGAVSRSRRRS